jgi:hypothetical protein
MVLSTVSVDMMDDDALTFTITSADFEIANGNELKTKRVLTTTGDRHVTIIASDGTRGIEKDFTIVVKKADEEDPDEKDPEEEAPVEDANAKVTAQSVRKESKSASKLYRLRNHRLWQCDLAYRLINRVLSANGLSNVIPTSSRKVERNAP